MQLDDLKAACPGLDDDLRDRAVREDAHATGHAPQSSPGRGNKIRRHPTRASLGENEAETVRAEAFGLNSERCVIDAADLDPR